MAERDDEDGDGTFICGRDAEGRYVDVMGFQERVHALLPAPGRKRLLCVQMQRALLSLYSSSVWLGSAGLLILQNSTTAGLL